ncbi:uncharacterized protein [Littorina saxatilis]|uniref:uncharacterized protein n=1 Tax=Littorina saxatilis TaxID=31220 RepID=UPI0038B55280
MKYTESTTATPTKDAPANSSAATQRRKSVMEVTARQTPTRRYSLTPTPYTPYTPSTSPSRYQSAFRPTTISAVEHEGTFRYSTSPSCSSTSSSPPRPSSPDDKVCDSSFRSLNLNSYRVPNAGAGTSTYTNHYHHLQSIAANAKSSRRRQAEDFDEENDKDNDDGDEEGEDVEVNSVTPPGSRMRPRTYSLPATHARGLRGPLPDSFCSASSNPWRDVYTCPVRSFCRTTKGVVNRGDSVRKCSMSSLLSSASGSNFADFAEERQRAMSIVSQDSITAACSPQGQGQAQGQSQGQSQGQGQDQARGVCGGVGVDGGADGALAPAYYRVAVMGTVEVGKSALCRQFLSSEYLGTYGDSCGFVR